MSDEESTKSKIERLLEKIEKSKELSQQSRKWLGDHDLKRQVDWQRRGGRDDQRD
jgi:hypothetical protein